MSTQLKRALRAELGQRLTEVNEGVNPNAAKKIIRAKLAELGLPSYRLSVKRVGFSGLARGAGVFVRVNGWKPGPGWEELQAVAKQNGFFVEAG